MASLFKRPTNRVAERAWRDEKRKVSQTYWVKYVGFDGAIHRESLGLAVGSTENKRKAEAKTAEATAREKKNKADHRGLHGKFSQWVTLFLNNQYQGSPKTLHRYNAHWDQLFKFLNEKRILFPSQVRHEHAQQYVTWRVSKKACRNTALQDLKVMRLIMSKAVKLEYIVANPLIGHGIKRDKPAEKPEFTNADIAVIRKELLNCEEWMRSAFEIALFTGCRLAETSIKMRDIDLANNTMSLHAKGGKDFNVRIHPDLLPLLARLKAEGRKVTLEIPGKNPYWKGTNSNHFSRFFSDLKERGLLRDPSATFHCTRVTYISRMRRSGMSRDNVKLLVAHASDTINKIYGRTKATDISEKALKAAGLPPLLVLP